MSLPKVGQVVTILPVPPSTEKRQGICKFVGPTKFADGMWVGVELVGSPGKNNGSVSGVAYFTCDPGKGVFIRPELIEEPKVDEAREDKAMSSRVIREMQNDIEYLKEQLQTKETRIAKLTEEKESMQLDLELAKEDSMCLRIDLEDARTLLASIPQNSVEEIESLRNELKLLQEMDQSAQAQIEDLKSQLEAADQGSMLLESLMEGKLDLQEERDRLLRQIDDMSHKYDELVAFSNQQEEEIQLQLAELNAHESRVETIADDYENEIRTRENTLKRYQQEIGRLEQQIEDLKASGEQHQAELAVEIRRLRSEKQFAAANQRWSAASMIVHMEKMSLLEQTVQSLASLTELHDSVETRILEVRALSARALALQAAKIFSEEEEVGRSNNSSVQTDYWRYELAIGFGLVAFRIDKWLRTPNRNDSDSINRLYSLLFEETLACGRSDVSFDQWHATWASLCTALRSLSSRDTTLADARALLRLLGAALSVVSKKVSALRYVLRINEVFQFNETLLEIEQTATDASQHVQAALKHLETQDPCLTLLKALDMSNLVEIVSLFRPFCEMIVLCSDRMRDKERGLVDDFIDSSVFGAMTSLIDAPLKAKASQRTLLLYAFDAPPEMSTAYSALRVLREAKPAVQRLWQQLSGLSAEAVSSVQACDLGACVRRLVVEEAAKKSAVDSVNDAPVRTAEVEAAKEWQMERERLIYDVATYASQSKSLQRQVDDFEAKIVKEQSEKQQLEEQYTSAFASLEEENATMQAEMKRLKSAALEAAKIAPYSQRERREHHLQMHYYQSLVSSTVAKYEPCYVPRKLRSTMFTPTIATTLPEVVDYL